MAKLSTLRLLRELPEWPAPRVKCMCFATPAVGNAALADLVKNAGWAGAFKTFFLPGNIFSRASDHTYRPCLLFLSISTLHLAMPDFPSSHSIDSLIKAPVSPRTRHRGPDHAFHKPGPDQASQGLAPAQEARRGQEGFVNVRRRSSCLTGRASRGQDLGMGMSFPSSHRPLV